MYRADDAVVVSRQRCPMRRAAFPLATFALLVATPSEAIEARGTDARGRVPAVSTVTFDFQSEIKTTFYSDGSVHEEGFDPARMRRLAPRPGSR